jgi:hypothetical protein
MDGVEKFLAAMTAISLAGFIIALLAVILLVLS